MIHLNRPLINQLILPDDVFSGYLVNSSIGKPKRLDNIEKINIFVGANNSGKSRLMRAIARNQNNIYEPPADLLPGKVLVRDVSGLSAYFHKKLIEHENPHQRISQSQPVQKFLDSLASRPEAFGFYQNRQQRTDSWDSIIESFNNLRQYIIRNSYTRQAGEEWLDNCIQDIQHLQYIESEGSKMIPIYIPTLRTLRDLGGQQILKKRTQEDYSLGKIEVFTGESMYSEVEKLLRGNLEEREKLRAFETWLSQTFFENKAVALIPRLNQSTLTIKIGDEQEKSVHELGDGIQSILILTFELFRHQNNHVLAFIEEPEMFLHPWLQRVFLEMLSSKGRFPKHQFFLTTHSNHFLDLTLDIPDVSVYTVVKNLDHSNTAKEKPATFTVRQITRENREPLELLGVRNSSVLLSNCTIWVEGITDRRYLAHWLELYNKFKGENMESEGNHRVFKEDLHYSFVEYAGSNITHYSFLDEEDPAAESETRKIDVEWLCGRLFLVTDQDGADLTTAKGRRQARLKEKLGDRYHCLEGREIENLISPGSLKAVLISYGEKEYPDFTHEAYLNEPLGTFLDDFLQKDSNRRGERRYADIPSIKPEIDDTEKTPPKRKRKGAGSTIRDKAGFCQRTITTSPTWSDLSPQAQLLTEQIYAFIQRMNT